VNLCRACGNDYGSVSAFDAHRVGKHAYTFSEGLRRSPPVEDGRRCLHPSELLEKGWSRDKAGRWRTPVREKASLRLAHLRRNATQPQLGLGDAEKF
jgi:hypothetical protein